MDKENIRKNIIQRMKELSPIDKKEIEQSLIHTLIHSSLWKNANTIGITVSTKIEWDTRSIIQFGWKQDKRIVVPKCHVKNKQLTFYEIKSFAELKQGYANIEEPDPKKTKKINNEAIDLLIVPGLAFNEQGYRIGFGGGYYDRFLRDVQIKTVSFVSDFQLIDEIPVERFDIPVNY